MVNIFLIVTVNHILVLEGEGLIDHFRMVSAALNPQVQYLSKMESINRSALTFELEANFCNHLVIPVSSQGKS